MQEIQEIWVWSLGWEDPSVQFSGSVMSDSLWATDCSMPGFPVLHYLPEFTQTHAHWVNDATQPPHPLSPFLLLSSIFPGIRVFSNKLALWITCLKFWSFSPSKEHSGLIFFRTDWFDLLAVQGTLKSLLQPYSSKVSIFSTQPSLWSDSLIHKWLLEKP